MTVLIDLFLPQAANSGRAAEQTPLPDQRAAFLRSQPTWREMATRKRTALNGRNDRQVTCA